MCTPTCDLRSISPRSDPCQRNRNQTPEVARNLLISAEEPTNATASALRWSPALSLSGLLLPWQEKSG